MKTIHKYLQVWGFIFSSLAFMGLFTGRCGVCLSARSSRREHCFLPFGYRSLSSTGEESLIHLTTLHENHYVMLIIKPKHLAHLIQSLLPFKAKLPSYYPMTIIILGSLRQRTTQIYFSRLSSSKKKIFHILSTKCHFHVRSWTFISKVFCTQVFTNPILSVANPQRLCWMECVVFKRQSNP